MNQKKTDPDKTDTDKALAELERKMVDKVAEMEIGHQKQLAAMEEQAGRVELELQTKLDEAAERDERLLLVGQQMSDKVAEMEADHAKALDAMQDKLDGQAATLDELEEETAPEGKGDPKQAELYRVRVLTDLLRYGHFPATDHPALHDPDLSADEWEGTAAERKALGSKVKALLVHLKHNPMPRGQVIVTAVSAERLR